LNDLKQWFILTSAPSNRFGLLYCKACPVSNTAYVQLGRIWIMSNEPTHA